MPDLVRDAVAALRSVGVELAPGLDDDELAAIERRWDLALSPDHRALLARALPLGPRWVDWRDAAPDQLRRRIEAPVDGVLFDVEHNGLWVGSWGIRPADAVEREQVARRHLAGVPRLVPLHGHRYTAAASPAVLSVHQSDVVLFGADLLDWVVREFVSTSTAPVRAETARSGPGPVPFWSDLARGADPREL